MGMFGQAIEGLKAKMQESADRKKQDQETLRRMRLEAREIERQEFEIEFRKHAREMAIGRAKQDAAKQSGIQKLRAQSRLRLLSQNSGQAKPGVFQRLSEHTQKNLANREENLKRTKELRDQAKKMQIERQAKRLQERQSRFNRNQTRTSNSFNRF